MTRTQGPKILQKIETLNLDLIPVLKKYPKTERYTLAEKTETFFLQGTESIYWAPHEKRTRPHHLSSARIQFQMSGYLLRIGRRMGFVSEGQYEKLSVDLVEIGKMISGWIKIVEKIESDAKNFQ